ncbi:MAG: SpoIIE family protein phosphatase [Chlamydiales bacterium]|nr:SpoIIE family protein phosphatase [Chlamydiia bacterium]MCP5503911.1 SpoIIE family protein phosphatase [Chlamydiales bacterium]
MKQGKKEKNHRVRGSLASRILLIALVFLVFPLLALVGLLYIEDTRIKSDNNYFTLEVLMDQKEDFVMGVIRHELDFLASISYLLPRIPNQSSVLQELAQREEVSALFHLKKGENGHFFSDMASSSDYLGRDYSGLVAQAKKGTDFVVDPNIDVFYLTRMEKNGEGAWVIAFTLLHVLKSFPIENEVIHPASTSIVAKNGKILSSTDPQFKGMHLPLPIRGEYRYKGVKYVTLGRNIPQTNFSLVIAAPKAINFVDVPYFILKVVIALSFIVVIGGGGAMFLTKKLSRPLKNLIRAMEGVGRGDLSRRFKPQKMGFEINTIGEIFNETVDSLNANMEAVQKERVERETYEKELRIGEEVQQSILPKKVPNFPGLEMAARFIAAKEVGGDFYDFLVQDQLMLSIADTSGKGISACLYSLSVRSMLRSYGEIHRELDLILKETNNLFCRDTGDTGVFVTAFVAFFDPKTKIFHYSNCGHFPALRLKKDGTIEKLTTKGMALGVLPFHEVITDQTKLESGDQLILFTDGIVEAHNEEMELFGEKRLIASLQEKKGWESQKIVDQVIEEVALFAEGTPQFDDLSLVVIKVL